MYIYISLVDYSIRHCCIQFELGNKNEALMKAVPKRKKTKSQKIY